MENLRELIRDIDKHMRAEWYAGRLPAESWPKRLSDRLAAAVAEKPWSMYEGSAGAIRAVDPDDLKAAPAAVAVPDERVAFEVWQESEGGYRTERGFGKQNDYQCDITRRMWEAWRARAALAATTSVSNASSEAAPVILPEPVTCLIERSAFHVSPHGQDAESNEWLEEAHEPGEEGSFPVYTEQQVRALLATGGQAQAVGIAELVTGMSVSVDVSTGDGDAGNRYFGTVTVAQEDPHDKHGLTLLVQDAKPNFTPQAQADARDAGNEWQEISTMPTCDDLIWLYCQETNTTDGPVAPDPSLEQFGWTHWAYANAPSTAVIDRAAIAAAKGDA